MMTIAEYKAWFNAEAILGPAEKFRKTLFRQFGAYTRAAAKGSMIDANAGGDAKRQQRLNKRMSRAGAIISGGRLVSRPGSAAFSRLGWVKQNIFFAADQDECVIGPALISGLKSRDAMDALEHGGTEQLTIAEWRRGQKVQRTVTAQYKARPTMGIAFEKAKAKMLPRLIAGGIMREA